MKKLFKKTDKKEKKFPDNKFPFKGKKSQKKGKK